MSKIHPAPLGQPITTSQELIDWFAAGEKPREQWLIGTAHEKFPFLRDDLGPVPYDGPAGMGYECYTDYALDVPMYFVHRNGQYIDVAGESFRDFLQGRLPQLPGELPRLSDWSNHLSTLFTDVRLKPSLEIRGADAGDLDHLCALSALWVGLLYDDVALDCCWDLVKLMSHDEIETARRHVPLEGLRAHFGSESVLNVARMILEIAHAALRRRCVRDEHGRDETIHLRSVQSSAATGMAPTEVLLFRFRQGW